MLIDYLYEQVSAECDALKAELVQVKAELALSVADNGYNYNADIEQLRDDKLAPSEDRAAAISDKSRRVSDSVTLAFRDGYMCTVSTRQSLELPAELAILGASNPAILAYKAMAWAPSPDLVESFVRLASQCHIEAQILPEKECLDAFMIVHILTDLTSHGGEILQFSITLSGETEIGRLERAFDCETAATN